MSKSEITADRIAAVTELHSNEFLSPANFRRMLRLATLVAAATGRTRTRSSRTLPSQPSHACPGCKPNLVPCPSCR